MNRPPVKVGLLLDGTTVPAWVARMLRILVEAEWVDIRLVVFNEAAAEATPGGWPRWRNRILRFFPLLALTLIDWLNRYITDKRQYFQSAFTEVDIAELLVGVPVLRVRPQMSEFSDRFSAKDVQSLKAADLDVTLRLGFRILRGDVLSTARCGCWSFHHGDNRVNRGGPPGWWEVMESWRVTGSMLQIITEDLDNGLVLYRSWSTTIDEGLTDSKSFYHWKSLSFVPRKLKDLHRLGPELFMEQVHRENKDLHFYSNRLYIFPSITEYLRLTLRKAWQKIKRYGYWALYMEQWSLRFRLEQDIATSLWRYRELRPPRDRFWADPHVLARDGKFYVFFEEYLYATARGHIACVTISADGTVGPVEAVLVEDVHLSYPFVFEHEGEVYMVPESQAASTISLYRCVDFPHRWELDCHLMESVEAADSTLKFHDGRWWLFTSVMEHEDVSFSDELFLFSREDLKSGEWEAHPENPIVSDARSSRPAGRLFEYRGQLYRPSQNSAGRYGYGFNIGRVEELTRLRFREHFVSTARPDWDPRVLGTHSFSHVPGISVIDTECRRSRWALLEKLGL